MPRPSGVDSPNSKIICKGVRTVGRLAVPALATAWDLQLKIQSYQRYRLVFSDLGTCRFRHQRISGILCTTRRLLAVLFP